MELTFAPRDILQIDGARIVYRNFSGTGSKYNREGDRNFAVVIPTEEMADELIRRGWNVKMKPPRDEDEGPFFTLPVKIKFNDRGPIVRLKSGRGMPVMLDAESIGCLDEIDILEVDMDLRPYDWEVNGKTGRTAYLQNLHVTQDIVDRFASRYED
jgi:hypothetical protein